MSLEKFLGKVNSFFKTQAELGRARDLIVEERGNVNMVVYGDNSGLQGRNFGPNGYDEEEIDAIRRELKKGVRVNVSGNNKGGVVTIINRNK